VIIAQLVLDITFLLFTLYICTKPVCVDFYTCLRYNCILCFCLPDCDFPKAIWCGHCLWFVAIFHDSFIVIDNTRLLVTDFCFVCWPQNMLGSWKVTKKFLGFIRAGFYSPDAIAGTQWCQSVESKLLECDLLFVLLFVFLACWGWLSAVLGQFVCVQDKEYWMTAVQIWRQY